ncbi:MAG: 50S ribosomal protein L25 [Candidatus Yonathbacteria bacterium]|nr:50S ribosomal protein L25 [Candidatus Yonathbacteria bacterium]
MTLTIEATERPLTQKAADIRTEGNIPAVVYGPKTENIALSVDARAFKKVWKEAGETTLVSVSVDGKKTIDALIHEITFHPVTDEPTHIDFYAVDKMKKVEVDIPLVFVGVAPAVKDLGGTLVKVLHDLPVEGLPDKLPHEIEVDIAALVDLESVIEVKDIVLPAGVESTLDPEEIVASISVQKEEEVAAELDLSAIEVEKKGKKEEDTV